MSMQTKMLLIFICLFVFICLSVIGNRQSDFYRIVNDSNSAIQHPLTILSWNIGMLPVLDIIKESDERIQAIATVLRDKEYDIIVFQEAFTLSARKVISQSLHDQYPFAYGPVNKSFFSLRVNSGIWILSKIPLKIRKEIEFTVSAGFDGLARKGAVLLDGLFYGTTFQLIATHLQDDTYPQLIREQQLTEIYEKLVEPFSQADVPQIICGDFNIDDKVVANYKGMLSLLDAEDGEITGTSKITFDDVFNDVFKSPHPDPRKIDYVLTRNAHLIQRINEKVEILKSKWGEKWEYLSDHNGLEAVIEFRSENYLTTVLQ